MKMFQTLGLGSVLAFAGLAGAADTSRYLHVNVPFAFVVAGQQFAPGEYDVKESYNGLITVQGEGKAAMVIGKPISTANINQPSNLQFDNASRRDLLSVAVEGEGSRGIPVHAAQERKLALNSR